MKFVKQQSAPMELLQAHGVTFIKTNEYGLHIISVPAKLTLQQLGDFIVAARSLRFAVRLCEGFGFGSHAMDHIDSVGLQMVMETF